MIPSASGSSATGSAQLTVDRLDHCAIQTLKKVLLLAEKSEGCLNDSEVWTMSPEGSFAPWIFGNNVLDLSDRAGWDRASNALRQTLTGLDGLTDFFKRGLDELSRRRDHKNLNVCHILKLPDEILAAILYFTCEVDSAAFEPSFTSDSLASAMGLPMSLSATCRRFRRVSLDTPSTWCLWQNVDARILEVFQQRSKGRSLSVYIDTEYHARKFREESRFMPTEDFATRYAGFFTRDRVVQSILHHRDNFRTLTVQRSGQGEGVMDVAIPELAQTSSWQGVTLPLLEELSVTYTDCDYMNKPHFYETWVMPRLRRFSIVNSIPNGPSCTALNTSLTSLQLTFNCKGASPDPYTDLSMRNLVDFLDTQQSLVDLTLRFDVRMVALARPQRTAVLRSLQRFHLYINFDVTLNWWITRDLLQSLETPALHSFVLSIGSLVNQIQRVVTEVLRGNERFTQIQDFDLRILSLPALGVVDLKAIYNALHSLRHLSITAPDDKLSLNSINICVGNSRDEGDVTDSDDYPSWFRFESLPLLESIRLCGNAFSRNFFQQLCGKYLTWETPEGCLQLRSVVLRNCRCFDENLEDIYRLVPASQVVWLDDRAGFEDDDDDSDDEL